MYSRYLREHIFTYNRFIGGYGDARIRFNHPADFVQTALINIGNSIEMVFQDSLHTCQRSIARTLAQTIDGSMKPFHATQHGSKHITHRQVIVIVSMEVEVGIRITLLHLPHELDHLQRIQNT